MSEEYTPGMDAIDMITQYIDDHGIENISPFKNKKNDPQEFQDKLLVQCMNDKKGTSTFIDDDLISHMKPSDDDDRNEKYEDVDIVPSSCMNNNVVTVNGKAMPVEMKDDFDTSRDNLKMILDTGMAGIQELSQMAQDTKHPRVYEILTTMLKTIGDLNKQLVELHKEKTAITKNLESSTEQVQVPGNVTNNTIFVGSTKELQDYFKQQKEQA